MSTPRFTLGPWEAAHAGEGRKGVFAITEYFVRRPGDDVSIAADIVDPATCSPSEANAHLIAAAPTLFGIVRQYMASDERQGFTGTILYEQAKAAIEAATGEKS